MLTLTLTCLAAQAKSVSLTSSVNTAQSLDSSSFSKHFSLSSISAFHCLPICDASVSSSVVSSNTQCLKKPDAYTINMSTSPVHNIC